MYKESIDEKISGCRGNINENPYLNDYFCQQQNNMYFFFGKSFMINIFFKSMIYSTKKEQIINICKRRPDDERLWVPLLPGDYYTLVECMIKKLGVKTISNVGGFFLEELRGLLNRFDVVPDLKEKCRVDELGYILF
jgi:hypothetical protein